MRIRINSPKYGIKYVIIDDNDYDKIKGYTWRVNFVRGKFYALTTVCRTGKKPLTIKMHRLILNLHNKPTPHIDHKNENGLDNRRRNMRKASIPQNSRNVGPTSRSVTGYKGVSLYTKGPQAGKFVVRLRFYNKTYFGGYFKSAKVAAEKYDQLAKKYHGRFAYQNFKK